MTEAITELAMVTAEVYEALLRRWPPGEYLSVREAPQSSDRQGRKLDLVVVSLWRSRGHELDGIEVKVSMQDWRRELKDAGKADWWWQRVNRFWIAAPAPIAAKIKAELPEGWGLLSCTRSAVKATVTPEKRPREPLTWEPTVGLLRAAADAGANSLQRAESIGYDRGHQAARQKFEGGAGDAMLRHQLDNLREKVQRFEEASGVEIGPEWNSGRIGDAVKLILGVTHSPARLGQLENLCAQLERSAAEVRAAAEILERVEPAPNL